MALTLRLGASTTAERKVLEMPGGPGDSDSEDGRKNSTGPRVPTLPVAIRVGVGIIDVAQVAT